MLTHLEPKVSTNPGGRKNNNRHSNLWSRVAEKDLKIYLWSQTSRILKGQKGKLPCLSFVLTKTRSHFWFPMLKADQCQDAKIKIEAAENTNLNLYALQFCIQDSWSVLMFWHQITFYYGADELPWLLDFQKCMCLHVFACISHARSDQNTILEKPFASPSLPIFLLSSKRRLYEHNSQ